jgi:phage baseplate assembly protein W
MPANYAFPVRFRDLMQGRTAPACTPAESVRQHIFLILITRFGECSFDPAYGCELWEYDFDHPADLNAQKHHLEQSIKNSIEQHEPRLSNVNIAVDIDTQIFTCRFNPKEPRIKKKINITVKGTLEETNQEFRTPAPYVIYFSPVSN